MDATRRRCLLGVAGALAALALGCRRQTMSGPAASGATRVVSLSPTTTETLFAVGAGQRVVGRSRFCNFPPEALRLPVVGGYVDANLEAIMQLAPDLVVGSQGPAGREIADQLTALGLPVFFPRTESMADIDAMIVEIATRVGARDSGERTAQKLAERRRAITRAVGGEPRRRVLLVFEKTPIVVAGPGSFPDEMLRLVNAENVMQSGGAYPTIGVETLVGLDPDVVLDASMAGVPGEPASQIGADDPGFRELAAMREGRLAIIRDEVVLRPGPRVGEGLAVLARALHPQAAVP